MLIKPVFDVGGAKKTQNKKASQCVTVFCCCIPSLLGAGRRSMQKESSHDLFVIEKARWPRSNRTSLHSIQYGTTVRVTYVLYGTSQMMIDD